MTTAGDIIQQAMKDAGVLGVGQTALAEDTADALSRLNMLIAQWRRKRWLVYHLVTYSVACAGQQSFTIGPTGNINITYRPDRIESAFIRQTNVPTNQVDFPLVLLPAREDYNAITLKTLAALPNYLFYDSGYPLGTLYPWPVPTANIYTLYVSIKAVLASFATLTQEIALPEEYHGALLYTLAVRLRSMYRLPSDPGLLALQTDALNVLRKANAQIGRLSIPIELHQGGVYNPFSDSYT